ncbi:MAG: TlyA family RNA methyltransferase [Oscillospiraceae bacterium]|jgi:23S rRNA (cytidine1920-2'-O)/16S rRNA (cytidine1409-2'-O)-methyltransferase|nr:TlyA family RNA methyltransferase [Oscillospiraceae bacterium]
MNNIRLDVLLAQRGLAESRERAKAIIMSGGVLIDGRRADKPGIQVDADANIEIQQKNEYVSRGGKKLEKALKFFGVSPEGRVCIDCGASTGGFTDCLLKNGARLVYAVDVGYGQLAWTIRNDPRVVIMERTNIRHAVADMFEPVPDLAVIDVSFISLAIVLPVVRGLLAENGDAVCLIKPQFEAGRGSVGKKGVVRDPETHKAVLDAFLNSAEQAGFHTRGLTHSPLRGPEGNIEFLGWLSRTVDASDDDAFDACSVDTGAIVSESHRELLGNA